MRISEISYKMLRVTKQYENDTASATVQLEVGDDPQVAFEQARAECDKALAVGRDASLRDKLKTVMSTPEGRTSLDCFLKKL